VLESSSFFLVIEWSRIMAARETQVGGCASGWGLSRLAANEGEECQWHRGFKLAARSHKYFLEYAFYLSYLPIYSSCSVTDSYRL